MFRGVVREAAGSSRGSRGAVLQEVEWLAKGKPLPGTITVEGIDHPITAGTEFGDFYR